MLLTTIQSSRRRATRRAAFTLLEVLIVVAILVILAGSASIALFKYLDDAKKGRAKADMMSIETALKKIYAEDGGNEWPQQGDPRVGQNLEQGQAGLTSPWGTPYTWQVKQMDTGGATTERPVISCLNPKTGETINWPER